MIGFLIVYMEQNKKYQVWQRSPERIFSVGVGFAQIHVVGERAASGSSPVVPGGGTNVTTRDTKQ